MSNNHNTHNSHTPVKAMAIWGITCALACGGATYFLVLILLGGGSVILNSFGIDLGRLAIEAAFFAAAGGLIFGIVLRAIIYSFKNNHN